MRTILFVEDDADLLKAYIAKLRMEKFQVEVVDNVEAALLSLNIHAPDCIILDIMLKGKQNGFDLLEIIKRDLKMKEIPVVVLTNLDSEEKVAKNIGADEYLVKTKTDPQDMVNRINHLIGKE